MRVNVDPTTGRFLQPDPIGIEAAHLYTYAGSNPYVFWDPTGLDFGGIGFDPPQEAATIGPLTAPRLHDYLAGGFQTGGVPGAVDAARTFFEQWQAFNESSGLQTGGEVFGQISGPRSAIWTATRTRTAVQNAFDHYRKHGFQFPQFRNALEYVRGARQFVARPPPGALSKVGPRGDIRVYDPATNTFGVGTAQGIPRTLFKPDDGIEYWLRQ